MHVSHISFCSVRINGLDLLVIIALANKIFRLLRFYLIPEVSCLKFAMSDVGV